MAQTIIGVNDAKAVKRYSGLLAVDTAKVAYWMRKFMGRGAESSRPIQLLPQLESEAGEQVTFDLSLQLKQQPIEGDERIEGKEEALKFYTDNLYIDQMRGSVSAGGRMTRKRTLHDLRKIARRRSSEWWARVYDELIFMYASGARGINAGFIFPTSYTGFAGNSLDAPDTDHILYAGDATAKNDLDATDTMDTALVDRAVAKAQMMGGGTEELPQIQPIMIDGEEHYVIVMSPWAAHDMRTATGASNWLEIQKAAATAEGRNSPIFKGGLGMHNNVVLHSHKSVIRFNDYGSGSNVTAERALFLGSQGVEIAFGSPGAGLRFDWHEEMDDRGNELVVTTNAIFGVKKCRFNSKDFGIISLEVASADPS